ncbi:MAG: hypothetical protein JRG91_09665 [Deltaproteobacteria bacterium]|nr:hypothetical protein [Deltaproteobacteria bacterium]
MTRYSCVFPLFAVIAMGCGGTLKATTDSETDPSIDETGSDGTTDAASDPTEDGDEDPSDEPTDDPTVDGGCTPAEVRCTLDMNSLETCQSDGTWIAEECDLGCSNEPDAHCMEWDISNIPDDTLISEGRDPTDPAWPSEEYYWVDLDTDTGGVDVYRTSDWGHVLEVRPGIGEGLHMGSGIHFEIVAQGEGHPELGVFTFRQLTIPSNYTFGVWGSRSLVLLSELDATIDGGVYAGCIWSTEPLGGASNAGAGAGAGGDARRTSASGGYRDGGGGGGAFGGAGGMGGGDSAIRGTAGAAYGTDEIIPLLGGSGGGDGGGVGAGRHGGRSGGAVMIVSGGTLTVSSTGWIDAGGCGGLGAESNEGGGGGGSGGGILLEAPTVVIAGTVTANGGAGAGGGGSSGATDGEDAWFGSDTVAAGGPAAGTYDCAGGNGSGGGTDAGQNAPGCTTGTYNFGGGGGAAGKVRVNGTSVDMTGSLFSPSMSTPSATQGPLNAS